MAPFPPEQPSLPAENEPPQPVPETHEEPRLLTRAPLDDAPSRPPASAALAARWEAARERRATRGAAHPPRPARSARRPLQTVTKGLLGLALVVCVTVLGMVLYLRHQMHVSLPQIDGSLRVSGLSAAVTVTRDEHGIPAIHAANLSDLLFAQGYVTAQDRLWQMDSLRRHAAGELAEILGPGLVEHDREQRVLQLRATADHAVAALPPDQRSELDAYARGVNAFINTHAGALPVEFSLLHYKPAPWQPRDSMLVYFAMWQDLTTSFPRKLNREALMAHLPAELAPDLYPSGSFRDRPPTTPREDLTTPKPFVLQIPLDSTQSALHKPTVAPEDLLRREHSLDPLSGCDTCRAGSNNWVVAGTRSASGAPLLSNDMHLGLTIPDIWYQASLHTQAMDVVGFTIPGMPFVAAGRNAHVAWGFTNSAADVQEVYVEHLQGSGDATQYQQPDGSWAPVAHHVEVIQVRGGRNVTLDVLTTSHKVGNTSIATPVISSLYKNEHRALALAWTLYDPAATQLSAFEQADAATSGAELATAFTHFGGPSLNLVWADDQHHIGYHTIGMVPVRGSFDRHPRMIAPLDQPQDQQQQTPADGEPNPDDPENNAGPQAALPARSPYMPAVFDPAVGAHLSTAAFVPARRRRAAAHAAKPAPRRRTRKAAPAQNEEQEAPLAAAPPAAPAIDYSIGAAVPDVPVDALNQAAQWAGYIPYDQLPSIVDPPNGLIATANARFTPDNYPYNAGDDWADSYRTERIYRLLENRTGLTAADMLTVQMDVHSELGLVIAQRLSYAIDHASPVALGSDAARLQQAAGILRRWDGNMTADSAAASLVTAFRFNFWPALLQAQIAAHDHLKRRDAEAQKLAQLYNWGESATAEELLLNHQPARWLPAGYANWNDYLAASYAQALKQFGAPRDLAKWTWGSEHRLALAHPLLSHRFVGRLLGTQIDPGPQPLDGDGLTVRATGPTFGASERFVADMASADATSSIPTGVSGNPLSPWYLDQFQTWLHGHTFATPVQGVGVAHTLTLTP